MTIAQEVFLFIIAMYGYNESLAPGEQSELAKTGIIIGWMLVPGLLLFLCFIVTDWYSLAGPDWKAIKQKLAEIHRQKEKEYLEKLGYKYVE